ncbi:ATP-binding protein [Massilia sp. W12]|uniref:GAF domain-containing sensor histidine kinase n=1 Tax=Massilia sp. W12 TaxID=3126507 RepID=UPI0030CFE121
MNEYAFTLDPGNMPELSPQEFATVLKALQTISCQSDVLALLDCALRVVQECSGACQAYFLLVDHGQLWLAGSAHSSEHGVDVDLARHDHHISAELPHRLISWVQEHRRNVLLPDLQAPHPFSEDHELTVRGAQSALCLPLTRQNQLIGILYLERSARCAAFDANKVAQLELFIAQTVVALENARLRDHLLQEQENFRATEAALSFKRILLRTLVENCPFRIYAKDVDSRFIFANQEVARVMGAARSEDLLGKTDFDFYPEELAQRYFDDEQALLRSDDQLLALEEPVIDQSTGQHGWTFTTKVHLRDDHGAILGIVGIGMDITGRKAMEAQLVKRNAELTELNDKLSQAHEQLVQSEKLAALGALVAGLAHELNTPISNGIMAASSLAEQNQHFAHQVQQGLKRSVLETFMEDVTHASNILMRNLLRSAELVASFKQIAIDQTSAQRRIFDLGEVVAEIVLAMSPTIKKTTVDVLQIIPAPVRMDSYPGPLGQVLINLLNNALLHGYENGASGKIEVRAFCRNDAQVELVVSDDGAGIPAANVNRIFDPFFTTKMGMGSSGLGLNIVHTTVTGLLGGHIRVYSEAGRGASFTLVLPLIAPLKVQDGDNTLLHHPQLAAQLPQ